MANNSPHFRIMKKGYDRFAVDNAITQKDEQIDQLTQRNEFLEKEVKKQTQELEELRERFQALSKELEIKEKAADEIARIAIKEANTIIDTAENNANAIVQEALSTAKLALIELAGLSQSATGLKADLKDKLVELMQSIDEFQFPAIPDMEWAKKEK